jgi:hypothetical protein
MKLLDGCAADDRRARDLIVDGLLGVQRGDTRGIARVESVNPRFDRAMRAHRRNLRRSVRVSRRNFRRQPNERRHVHSPSKPDARTMIEFGTLCEWHR